ncbi:MAG: hypothetical protein KDD25_02640 [Bdellovibrionales bacterium]|nr:hypothetical protein [Bdellovibrionales bacterium]
MKKVGILVLSLTLIASAYSYFSVRTSNPTQSQKSEKMAQTKAHQAHTKKSNALDGQQSVKSNELANLTQTGADKKNDQSSVSDSNLKSRVSTKSDPKSEQNLVSFESFNFRRSEVLKSQGLSEDQIADIQSAEAEMIESIVEIVDENGGEGFVRNDFLRTRKAYRKVLSNYLNRTQIETYKKEIERMPATESDGTELDPSVLAAFL